MDMQASCELYLIHHLRYNCLSTNTGLSPPTANAIYELHVSLNAGNLRHLMPQGLVLRQISDGGMGRGGRTLKTAMSWRWGSGLGLILRLQIVGICRRAAICSK